VDDYTIINNYVATLDTDTELQRIPAASHSRRGNLFAHQGLPLDAELASYQNRARQYAPAARRFMQRDPLITISRARSGYEDGLSLSEYVRSRPTIATDPTGLLCFCPFNPLNPAKGELTVDDSCSGKCPIWVIPEDKNKPAYTPAESGKTVPADGFVLEDGTVYKIDGSTCVTISDAGGGTIKISTCVNFCARLAGKGKAHPVPPGTFSNEPPQGAAPSPSD
jgi:RHS repeat-associated protein